MKTREATTNLTASVLIVDDDPKTRQVLATALEVAGFRVARTADGPSALIEFRSQAFDCVILDVAVPGMSGFDVCKVLRAIPSGQNMPIIMRTGAGDMESGKRAFDAGATDVSSKDTDPMLLALRVKFLVRSKQTLDQLRDSEAQVRYLAYYDPLTALPNRQRLLQILEQHVAWAVLQNRGIAVLMLDLDSFARFNDTEGQAVGDSLLQEVALRLRACVREAHRATETSDESVTESIGDWVARTGADEFALALPGVATTDAAKAVARRVQAILLKPFAFAQQEISVSASVGISLLSANTLDAEALVKSADTAMHHAKRLGPGGVEFFKRAVTTRAARQVSLQADLRQALERGEFTLNYQPRLRLADLRVEAVEALLRWTHPQRGPISPDEFIPLAEQSGLIVEIGDWVLHEACAQARRWHDAGGPQWKVAVNVSGAQFRDGSLLQRVSRAVDAAGIDSRLIELEFTEGALIEYSSAGSRAVKGLKSLGVATALDDFGTGYSSMSYLRHFPIDTLKIDRVFVRDIASTGHGNVPLVDAIIVMAKSLGLTTVAEGVETDAQWQYLRDRGATQVQGFLFCKPLAVPDLLRWYDEWRQSGPARAASVG